MDRSGKALSESRRRRAPRAPAGFDVAYEDPERQVFLEALDLSETGIWLAAPNPPAPGVYARLTVDLPGHSALLRLPGRVVRRRLSPGPGFALEFDASALTPEARGALQRFVASREVPSPG